MSTRLAETAPNTTYAQATLNPKYSEAYTNKRQMEEQHHIHFRVTLLTFIKPNLTTRAAYSFGGGLSAKQSSILRN